MLGLQVLNYTLCYNFYFSRFFVDSVSFGAIIFTFPRRKSRRTTEDSKPNLLSTAQPVSSGDGHMKNDYRQEFQALNTPC